MSRSDSSLPAPKGATISPTLVNLDRLWTIAVGNATRHRRLLGGVKSRRFATDGGALVLISESEFLGAEAPWSRPAGLDSDHWSKKSLESFTLRTLARPDEVRPLTNRLAIRYDSTWLSSLYVDIFLRLGGSVIRLAEDPRTAAVVPDLGVIMPCDPDAIADWPELDR